MTRWVAVGRVGRPHGLDGSFVVERASEDPGRFAPGRRLYAGREPVVVVSSKRSGGRQVISLDRRLERGTVLELPEAELPPLPEGEYYAFQLVGLEVVEDGGAALGTVREVVPGVANDVLELDTGTALPLVEDVVLAVDLQRGVIRVARGLVDV